MEVLLDVDLEKLSDCRRLRKPESVLSPLLLLIPGKSEVSLLAQDEVREERISVNPGAGIVLVLADLERLVTLWDLDIDGLRFFPDRFLILVQNLKS